MKACSLIAMLLLFCAGAFAGDGSAKTITCEGRLKTGIMSIGGETTGTILMAKGGIRYELDFGGDAQLVKEAESLDGKEVSVTGELRVREGVETGARSVVLVKSLKAAEEKKP